MSFEEFRFSKRREDERYPDWQEWLEKRLDAQAEKERAAVKECVMRGGDNFTFVCWGDLMEVKLWER